MSEKVLLVLYTGKDGNTWCEYSSGREEANKEYRLMAKDDDTLEEAARIWITKDADVEFYRV